MTKNPIKQPDQTNSQKDDSITQAVIITETFDSRFNPLAKELPKALFPLVNVPMVEYSLEMLSKAGMKEIFLVCNSFSDQWKEYLKKSRWSKSTAGMSVKILFNAEAASIGDALRDIDDKGIIQKDFLLLHADTVSNIDLSPIIEAHRQRRKLSKEHTLTLVLKHLNPGHYARQQTENAVFGIDSASSELLSYFPVESELNTFEVPLAASNLFKAHPNVQMRFDLIDCHLNICSPELLHLFTENFDYQDLRKDFVRGILTSELAQNKFYCHVVENDYLCRVSSPYLYEKVSGDLVKRWAFPLVPECSLLDGEEAKYSHRRKNIYLAQSAQIAHSAEIIACSVVGPNCEIGEDCRITNSILGPNVRIADGCIIENSYLWSNVHLEEGCKIKGSIIANGCLIKAHTCIEKGSLISFGCTVGPGAFISAFSRLSAHIPSNESLEEAFERSLSIAGAASAVNEACAFDERIWKSQEICGSEANCYIFNAQDEDASERQCAEFLDDSSNIAEREDATKLASEYSSRFQLEFSVNFAKHLENRRFDATEEEEEEEELEEELSPSLSPSANTNSLGPNKRSLEIFLANIQEMVKNAVISGYSIENTALEINALKFACNSTFHDCRRGIIPTLCSFIEKDKISTSTRTIFDKWGYLLQKFVHSIEDQIEVCSFLQAELQGKEISQAFLFLIPLLYKIDLLEEESIKKWYYQSDTGVYREQLKPFIQWLERSDDEEEDDEEEE
jgi:translation initiation factor eIF-2B subunit epsilon